MELNQIQWSGAPSCQRGSFAFYKSVSSRTGPEGPVQIWRLGEFYFIRCGPQDPVCIAEVTLLWEDQTRRHLLASARLYFLPEDTPKGRTGDHGEDEVLAVSRKMVVRVEDLVRWSCVEPAGWNGNVLKLASPCGTNGLRRPPQSDTVAPARSGEPLQDRTPNGVPELQGIKVLSYPQYCRFRSLQRRIQDGARGPGLQNPHLLALGGVKVQPRTRLMYCRDTFSHPTLEGSAGFSWQFRCPSLSLRGRPRKRRGRDSPGSVQPESWIEKMKENVMGSVEAGLECGWLPHPEEQLFLDQLLSFMERRGSPIHKVPNLGFKKIDLFLLFSVVKRLGGYQKVTSDRMWKVVYNELGGCPGSTSAATCTRRHYERLMLPYEEHLRAAGGATGGAGGGAAAGGGGAGGGTGEGGGGGAEFKIPESPLPHRARGVRGRKPLNRGRKPGTRSQEKRGGANAAHAAWGSDGAVVKRGRGRPPGTRNKTTVTKLLSRNRVELPARGGGGRVGTAVGLLSSDLAPLPRSFSTFPKAMDLKPDRGVESVAPAPSVLLSTLPRHLVGASLGGFSPIKGVCPLDVFRSRMSLQRRPEGPGHTPQDPAQHPPTIYSLQPKSGNPDTPPLPSHQHHARCSGCDEGGQRGGCREGRSRPTLPPLRVLPLNLDCSVQVCQLMRTRRLDSSHLQTFTRRLSEALSQDLSAKQPCAPPAPPPEQALPLNLSKRFSAKRPPPQGAEVNGDQSPSKRSRSLEDCGPVGGEGGGGVAGGGSAAEEPADLSSPSRIRAFLLGLPPFQVKLEEDLNGMRIGKLLPAGSEAEPQWTDGERGGGVKEEAPDQEEEQRETENRNKVEERAESADADAPCL